MTYTLRFLSEVEKNKKPLTTHSSGHRLARAADLSRSFPSRCMTEIYEQPA